ncbi:MAG TPA: AAA family ATPase [Verrucomicrobiota bacterium]|nr:AAA family ATPase [Verrucomicrobiota bacterium]
MKYIDIPHDSQAEAGVLGCVLSARDGEADGMLAQLEERDFHDVRHIAVFRALTTLQFDNKPVDVIGLCQLLKESNEIENAGGFFYVSRLPDQTPSPEAFPTFLEIVRDRAARRAMLRDADEIRQRALDLRTPVEDKPRSKLPAVEDAAAFINQEQPEPPQLVWGVLHKGCKLALGGGSKTFKTWSLIDLALAVSHGEPWLSFKTTRARVCYVNLELPPWSLHSRLRAVAAAKQIRIQPGWLLIWNLRGHATSYSEIIPQLSHGLRNHEPGLIILDPIYKLLGNADENSARDINSMLNHLEALAQKTGAAIAFASHFSKGNQASKEAVDRISGSGVFARDPDAILTFTRHETEGAFTVDATLRNCKAVEPFVVRWLYPMMRRDDELDPAKLKQPKGGRTATYTVEMILQALGKRKLTTAQWQKRAADEAGITRPTFYRLMAEAEKAGRVTRNEKGKWKVSEVSNPPSETSESIKSHIPLGYETDTKSEVKVSKPRSKEGRP